jgi:hypothetical protein
VASVGTIDRHEVADAPEISSDRAQRDHQPEFQERFIRDAFLAPGRVCPGPGDDQPLPVARNGRPAGPGPLLRIERQSSSRASRMSAMRVAGSGHSAGDDATSEAEGGGTFPGPIDDQQLLLDEQGLGDHGARPSIKAAA